MKANEDQTAVIASDLTNWRPVREIAEANGQFTYAQLKALFWKADEHPGLSRCTRIIGKRRYVCAPLFGLYLAGLLPEQQGGN